MIDPELELLKESSVGHSSIKAARLYNERMIGDFRTTFSLPDLRLYHLNLFAYIDLDGSSIKQISKSRYQ